MSAAAKMSEALDHSNASHSGASHSSNDSSSDNGTRILYCNCAYAQIIPEAVKTDVLEGLAASGVSFDAVADLCELSARRDGSLKRLASGPGKIKIAACYPRAVNWLFAAAGAPLPKDRVEVRNMRVESAEETLKGLLGKS